MSIVDALRQPELLRNLGKRLSEISPKSCMTIMEVCGTHTMAIHRSGLRSLLPEQIRLLSGPGCPVCVTPTSYLDTAMAMVRQHDVVPVTFGDMMRVPGSEGSLTTLRTEGKAVEVVYSPLAAITLAKQEPDKQFVFLSVGFETTTPTIAATLHQAVKENVTNFSLLCANKILPPALELLVSNPDLRVDGFLMPGHVSLVLGTAPYQSVALEHKRACVIAGFEPADIMLSLLMLVEQFNSNQPRVDIQYRRTVRAEGNAKARALIDNTFKVSDTEWRGFGIIPASGQVLQDKFAAYDASHRFPVDIPPTVEPAGCRCGEILSGLITPPDCPLYAKACTPENPIGACMVSSEGTCAACYKYSRS